MTNWNWITPSAPTTLTGKFAAITRILNDTLFTGKLDEGFLTHAVYELVNRWVMMHVVRIRLLIAGLQDGTVRTRRSPQPGLTRTQAGRAEDEAVSRPGFAIPRRFAWLLLMVQRHGRGLMMPHEPLESLLAEPEMLALMAGSPRLVRTMRPLCRALAVRMPRFPTLLQPAQADAEPGAAPARARPAASGRPGFTSRKAGLREAGRGRAARAMARFAAGDPRFRN